MGRIHSFLEYPKFKATGKTRLIELFAGIGAQAKALENIGSDFEHWFVCEKDEKAVKSYNAIHGTDFSPTDICAVNGEDLRISEKNLYTYILTYSFPCQDLSCAGLKKGLSVGTRSGLLWEVMRILNECEELPQVLVMENVPQVLKADGFQNWVKFLEEKGYQNFSSILNAKDFGIPQNRKRAFMVSVLGEYSYSFPCETTNAAVRMADLLEPEPVNEKYYLTEQQTKQFVNSHSVQVERERETAKTIRVGGSGSFDGKHTWDVIIVHNAGAVG